MLVSKVAHCLWGNQFQSENFSYRERAILMLYSSIAAGLYSKIYGIGIYHNELMDLP